MQSPVLFPEDGLPDSIDLAAWEDFSSYAN